jgi:hypothetical protein
MAPVGLIVASLDLKLVRLLRGAMNAGCHPCGDIGPRRRHEPEPRFEPRKVFHPTPRFEPRKTIHVEPRVVETPSPAPAEPEQPTRLESPLQPPWKVAVWKCPIQPTPQIKVVVHRPDVVTKGSLIDFFI